MHCPCSGGIFWTHIINWSHYLMRTTCVWHVNLEQGIHLNQPPLDLSDNCLRTILPRDIITSTQGTHFAMAGSIIALNDHSPLCVLHRPSIGEDLCPKVLQAQVNWPRAKPSWVHQFMLCPLSSGPSTANILALACWYINHRCSCEFHVEWIATQPILRPLPGTSPPSIIASLQHKVFILLLVIHGRMDLDFLIIIFSIRTSHGMIESVVVCPQLLIALSNDHLAGTPILVP